MPDKVTNIAASVRQRLKNLSDKEGRDFQILMGRYVLERILYRLSISPLHDEFVLKGAMLQAVWLENPFRNTRDLDLHARGEEDAEKVLEAFKTILMTKISDDGVTFDIKQLSTRPIRENVSYGGVRLTTTAYLGTARVPVTIDVGFGDAITPKPELAEYPSLLDLPKPRLLVYPRETVIAEKFEAMVSLGITNSRMKDFHDVAVMASTFAFNGTALIRAFTATFKRRGTPLPKDIPPAFSDAFTKRPETIAFWNAFVTREAISKEYSDLDAVIRVLRSFLLQPAYAAQAQREFPLCWPPNGPWSNHE
jgi:predicted nucleotidyltransferase component of viral defense system